MTAISEVLHQGALVTKASKALILLHGRGGTAKSILGLAYRLNDTFYIAAPQATNNTWYPRSFMEEERANEPYLSLSIKEIKDLIDQTARYIPNDEIYVVGFSQGACLALEVTTRFAKRYGGIVAFTGGLIGSNINEEKYHGDFEKTKVFISNGYQDPHIPLIRSKESKEFLDKMNAKVVLKLYENKPHTIIEDELSFVKNNILLL